MKISRHSWHYRFLTIFTYNIPTSLCPYFWTLVLFMIVATISIGGLICMVTLMTSPIWFWFFEPTSLTKQWLGVGIFIDVTAIGFVCYLMIREWSENRRELVDKQQWEEWKERHRNGFCEPASADVPPKQPNLLIMWWRATRDKVCPIIEFED